MELGGPERRLLQQAAHSVRVRRHAGRLRPGQGAGVVDAQGRDVDRFARHGALERENVSVLPRPPSSRPGFRHGQGALDQRRRKRARPDRTTRPKAYFDARLSHRVHDRGNPRRPDYPGANAHERRGGFDGGRLPVVVEEENHEQPQRHLCGRQSRAGRRTRRQPRCHRSGKRRSAGGPQISQGVLYAADRQPGLVFLSRRRHVAFRPEDQAAAHRRRRPTGLQRRGDTGQRVAVHRPLAV